MKRSNRSPLWRLPEDLEVREEMETHLELMVRDLIESGLEESEARRRAAARFGDAAAYAEQCRSLARQRNRRWAGSAFLGELRQDLQAGVRQIRRHATVSLTIVAMLALGLGAVATSLDLVFAAVMQPPPFDEPDRLLTLWEHQTARDYQKNVVSPANFLAWKEGADAFSRMAAFITVTFNLTEPSGGREPERVKVRSVTDGYFDVLAKAPLAGRLFRPEDAAEEAADVVLLSHHVWQQRYGARKEIVGETLVLDGTSHEIVGVLPADVALDMGPTLSPYGDAADLFVPLAAPEAWRIPRGRWLQVLARLDDGASIDEARQQLDAVMQRQLEQHPQFSANWQAQVVPLAKHLREPLEAPVLALAGGALLVLLIACFNASSLLLGRVLARGGELEVRAALGAGRARLLRQLMVEGAVLAACAGALAFLLSGAFGSMARAALPIAPPPPGGSSLIVLAALTAACALIFGFLPSIPALRRLAAPGSSGRAIGSSRHRFRLRSALVFAQVALTLVLLIGAGLMLRTVWRLLDVDPGFDRDGIVSFSLSPPRGSEAAAVNTFYDQLLERIGELGGIESVGTVSHLPMASAGAATSHWPADRPRPEAGQENVADIRIIRGDYFATLGIPLLEGRAFDGSERADHEPGSIVISESVAEAFWPGESALDRELVITWGDDDARRVIGVVADVRHAALGTPPRAAIYFPASQERNTGMTVVLETRRDPEALVGSLRALIRELDASLPLYDMQTVRGVLDRSISHQKLLAWSLFAFALLAILLAAVGIYGLTALTVTQSTREIGLRMALGASPGGVALRFLARIARLTAAALLAGLASALLLGRSLEALLVDIEAWDPATLAVTALLLGFVALAAALVPVRRATRLDPTRALRWD
ncbi:MAG: ABC transporter permease [Holophagales bacterium]|nr:ABC transporter permease [Holophagales bacterium]